MTKLNLTLHLTLTLALSQFACGRSSYKSYIMEKPKAAEATSGDATAASPSDEDLDKDPVVERDEELPAVDVPVSCPKTLTLAQIYLGATTCPKPTLPDPTNPTKPTTPTPPTVPPVDNPSQN